MDFKNMTLDQARAAAVQAVAAETGHDADYADISATDIMIAWDEEHPGERERLDRERLDAEVERLEAKFPKPSDEDLPSEEELDAHLERVVARRKAAMAASSI